METVLTPANKVIENINWEYLLESIEEEKCILCLGPGIYDSEQDIPFDRKLSTWLTKQEKDLHIRVYEDGWFHYLPDASEIDAWKKIKDFYNQPCPKGEAILDKIACIPFHFILTFTPDYKMREAFTRQHIAFQADSYIKKMPFDPNAHKPNKQFPLVYNLMGETNKRNSMVMTYNDLYIYLESVFEGNSMAPVLKENIWDADYFIFLGVPFDKWYIHLFMRILQQHDRKRTSKKYAANPLFDANIATSCAEQYTMTFVPNGIEQFVETLFNQCQTRNLMRTPTVQQKATIEFDKLKSKLLNDDFGDIFSHLHDNLKGLGAEGDQFKQMIFLLEAQANELNTKIIHRTLSFDEEQLLRARLRESIFLLILQIERHLHPPQAA